MARKQFEDIDFNSAFELTNSRSAYIKSVHLRLIRILTIFPASEWVDLGIVHDECDIIDMFEHDYLPSLDEAYALSKAVKCSMDWITSGVGFAPGLLPSDYVPENSEDCRIEIFRQLQR